MRKRRRSSSRARGRGGARRNPASPAELAQLPGAAVRLMLPPSLAVHFLLPYSSGALGASSRRYSGRSSTGGSASAWLQSNLPGTGQFGGPYNPGAGGGSVPSQPAGGAAAPPPSPPPGSLKPGLDF